LGLALYLPRVRSSDVLGIAKLHSLRIAPRVNTSLASPCQSRKFPSHLRSFARDAHATPHPGPPPAQRTNDAGNDVLPAILDFHLELNGVARVKVGFT